MSTPTPGTAGTVPLNAPYYGAPFGVAFARFWQKYATFSGRASRSEYWWWYLVGFVVNNVFSLLALALGGYGLQLDQTYAAPSAGAVVVFVIWGLWALATIVPGFALLARRLHDGGHSAGWIFILLVPFVGAIVVLVMVLQGPSPDGIRFDV